MSKSFVEEINENNVHDLTFKEESIRRSDELERIEQRKGDDNPEDDILCSQVGGKTGTILYNGIEANGFHLSAGSYYIYPTNYPVRQYQASIVKTALFKNTLVSLPTGLGKTFIAAVVMYNFYRWYPLGKVVFMAPTRPLVAQQTKACHHIMNIPLEDTTEMTGMQSAEQRTALWQSKRVFYLTPQVMVNDLKAKTCPASLIKCIVIDEAHRATKDYAYCQVLKILSESDAVFRILGLSATPGSDVNAVQQVVQNLHIAALEMRSEESLDVAPFTHSRDINPIVVELSGNILRVKEDLLQVFEKYAKKLKDFKALSYNISSISKFQVLKACEKFRANPPRGVPPAMIGSLISDFTVCMSLAHSLELLQTYGLRAFYSYLTDDSGEKTKAASTRLRNDDHIKEMLKRLHLCLFPKSGENLPYTWGHPKLQKLVSALSEHFKKDEEKKTSTKAIIFCQYRVVVNEIVQLLKKYKPLINAMEFIGQSGGKDKGMPQAKQLQIMKDFRNGFINCLVATCVAEEGLDIGEVDLIILMEAHKSPVRLVQRLGRTGRKRKGNCIILLTRGKEEQKFHEAMATRKSYVQNIVNAPAVKSCLSQESPRMIPSQFSPVQKLVHIKASHFESPARPQNRKQVDIRKCFAVQDPGPPHLSDEDLLQILDEVSDTKLISNKIPRRQEIWHKQYDKNISLDDLLSNDLNMLSEWNEWNYDEHQTYFISHTSQTKMLCHLLKASNEEITLTDYYLFSDLSIDAEDAKKKDEAPSKGGKKRKKNKNELKNNMGMDIRNCINTAFDKKVVSSNEIIEILSDISEDNLPKDDSEPKPKRNKVSEDELSFNSKSFCFFEVNNKLCNILSKYLLPKDTSKKSFSFKPVLPNLEMVLDITTYDILIEMDKQSKIYNAPLKIVKSPIVSIIESPLSSTFGIDDLFDEGCISHERSITVHDLPKMNHFEEKQNFGNTDKLNNSDIIIQVESPIKMSVVSRAESEHSFDIDDILNSNIGLCEEDNMSLGDKKLVNNKNYVTEDKSPSFNKLKTLTSSFIDIQRNNLKIFESFKEKRNGLSQSTTFCPAVSEVSQKMLLQDSIMKNELNGVNDFSSSMKLKHQSLDPAVALLDDDHDFECIEEDILNCDKVPKFCSTPKKCLKADQTELKNVCSPLSTNDLSVTTNFVSSTPLITVKKFKKNVILLDKKVNSCAAINEKEENVLDIPEIKRKSPLPVTPLAEKRASPSFSDAWSLSDILEEDEESSQAKPQNSTMLGITQMVSLIEKDKKRNAPSETVDFVKNSKSIEFSPPPSIYVGEKRNMSTLLESDVDIFCELNEQHSPNKCFDEVQDDIYENNIMLTQKYNLSENNKNPILINGEFNEIPENNLSQETDFPDIIFEKESNLTNSDEKMAHEINDSFKIETIITQCKSSTNCSKKDIFHDNFENDLKFKQKKEAISMDSPKKISLLSDVCELKPTKMKNIDSSGIWDDYDYNDVLLTQKYNDGGNEKFLIPEKDDMLQKFISNNSPTDVLDTLKVTQNDTKVLEVNNDVVVHEKSSIELASSESLCPSQISQNVNFKKFNKKSALSLKWNKSVSENDISLESSTNKKLMNNQNNESCFKKFKSETSSHSEKIVSKTEINFSNVINTSTKEPKAKVSLFPDKFISMQQKRDDSDDDVFNLPSSSNLKATTEKKLRKTFQNDTLPLYKKADFKEKNNQFLPRGKKTLLDPNCNSKRFKGRHGLIEEEADVSGEFSSDDSDGSSLDNLDASFINDNTECFTQTMYLKSVKSPVGQGKFKIPISANYTSDVYSQQIAEEESEYVHDSFCVDSQEESIESNEQSLSLLEVVEKELDKKKKGYVKRKRQRILNNYSEDSLSPINNDVNFTIENISNPQQSKKRKYVLSDSESDSSPMKRKKSDTANLDSPRKINESLSHQKTSLLGLIDLTSSENEDTQFIKGNNKSESLENAKQDKYYKGKLSKISPNVSKLQNKLDKKLVMLNKQFTNNLDKIKQKYFGSDDSSD